MSDRVRLSPSARTAIESEARLDVLLLLEQDDRTATEIAKQLGRSRQAVLHHLRALIDAGLVREVSSEPIAGGPLRTYGVVRRGWAGIVEAANAVADHGGDTDAGETP